MLTFPHIQPLRTEDLPAAQRVAAALFPWEEEHHDALAAAVHAPVAAHFCQERKLESVRCWTAHAAAGSVSGLASLYSYRAQPGEVWLAWFGLLPEARGHGAGVQFLEWLIERTRQEGRRTLRLWTTDESEYEVAMRLYLSHGFIAEAHPAVPGETWRTVVLSLGLDGQAPVRWADVMGRGELCGRQVAVTRESAAA